jgi:copper transport protein
VIAKPKIENNILPIGWVTRLLLTVFFVMLLSPSIVNAHSNLEKTYPQPDEVLSTSPAQIDLWFEDPVVIHSDSIQIINKSGNHVTDGVPNHENGNQQHVMVSLQEGLSEGAYNVRYNVIALDGYVVTGEYTFHIALTHEEEKTDFKIVKTSPADGEIVDSTVKQIDLWFTQPAQLSAVGVFGQQKDLRTGESYVDKEDPRHIIVPIEGTPEQGTYQLTWYATPIHQSNSDILSDHVGVFYFSVDQVSSLVRDQTRPLMQPFYSGFGLKHAAHALAFLGLLSLTGLTWFQVAIRNDPKKTSKPMIVIILYTISVIGFGLLLLIRRQELMDLPLPELLSIQFIWAPLLQLILLTLSFWLFRNKIKLIGYSSALLLWPISTGHSTYPRYGGVFSTVLDIVHLFSISIWMGGLLALIAFVPKEDPMEWVKEAGSKYSKWAFWSMLLIAATGIGMTLLYLPGFSLRSLLISDWGKGLLIKIVLTTVIIGLAVLQRSSIQRISQNVVTSVVRRGRLELLYGVLVLFAAAIVIESKPSAASQGIFPSSVTKAGITVSASIDPIDVGRNDINIQFKDAPAFTEVKVKLRMPPDWWKENVAFSLGDGAYKVTGNFLHGAGTMIMEITASQSDGSTLVFPFRIIVPGEMRFNEAE